MKMQEIIDHTRTYLPDQIEVVGGIAIRQLVVGSECGKMCLTESSTDRGLELSIVQDSDGKSAIRGARIVAGVTMDALGVENDHEVGELLLEFCRLVEIHQQKLVTS